MGHRANFVLIKDGKAQAYQDQWAALGCTLSLEEGANRLAKSVPKMYEPTDELMEWGFAEGGFLIDYDEHLCIAFGYPDIDLEDIPEEHQTNLREKLEALDNGWEDYVHLIEKGWKGYQMIWDGRGVDAFAEHLQKRGMTGIKTQKPSCPKDLGKRKPSIVHIPEARPKKKPKGV